MTKIFLALLRAYQYTLSPDHGWFAVSHPYGFCLYQPTCSAYAIEAVQRLGWLRGGLRATRRVLRCHPFAQPKFDPVLPSQRNVA